MLTVNQLELKPIEAPDSEGCYFVLWENDPSLIKVGRAVNIRDRLSTYECYAPWDLRLVAATPFQEYESDVHRMFASYRHRTEWFRLEGELLTFVQALNQVRFDAFKHPAMARGEYGPCLVITPTKPESKRSEWAVGWRSADMLHDCCAVYLLWKDGSWGDYRPVRNQFVRRPDIGVRKRVGPVRMPEQVGDDQGRGAQCKWFLGRDPHHAYRYKHIERWIEDSREGMGGLEVLRRIVG